MNDASASAAISRLGLGTVQFGLDYGATNAAGKVPPDEVRAILDLALSGGIRLLDTAFLYGNSEAVIGGSGLQAGFDIVTKTDKVSDAPDAAVAAGRIGKAFAQSLERLGVQRVYGLMLHDPKDLLGPYADAVWEQMREIRSTGRAWKIGVSVYECREIDRILDRYDIDLIQVPFNALDRRLVDGGQLAALAGRGVEIHARSIFLQGILLLEPDRLPEKFVGLRPIVGAMRESFTAAGLTAMEGLIASVLHRNEIRRIIVGTTSARDLGEIAAAARRAETLGRDFLPGRWDIADERLLNPAMWHAL